VERRPLQPPLSPLTGRNGWLLALVACTCLALLYAAAYYLSTVRLGQPEPVKALWWSFMNWYGWALLLPAIAWNCRRLLRSGRTFLNVGGHILAAAFFALAHSSILATGARIEAAVFHTGFTWFQLWSKFILINDLHNDIFSYGAIVAAWHMFDNLRRLKDRELQARNLEVELGRAQLHALKMQLHPHFLFNTLNGIAGLIYEDPPVAYSMLAKLSNLLRITLAASGAQQASVKQEIDFNRLFLEIEKMRLGDRLSYEIDVPPDTLEASVPSFLLQPLVENSPRHGIAPFAKPGRVRVRVNRMKDELVLSVGDSGPGLGASEKTFQPGGIGLANTRSRLLHLYGNAHRIDLGQSDLGGLEVRIQIPFSLALPAAQESILE
jgi:hypothetical protein